MPDHRKTCPECREAFTAQRSDARYCSHRCRQAAYRRRQREKRRAERELLAALEKEAATERKSRLIRLIGRLTRWWRGD
jgi:endogenous inhibitor of DNA gyrase (YacG/DUF329 family)